MAFFKKSNENVNEYEGGEGGKYISTSGMFEVNVIAPFVSAGNAKASVIDLCVTYNEQTQPLFGGMSYTNKDGSANQIGREIFNKFVVISGVDEVSDPIDAELPIGKKGAMKAAAVLEDLADIDVIVQITMEYGIYNNNITERSTIKSFFRASDKASAAEIIAAEEGEEVVFGSQYEKLLEGASFVKYSDGLTEERVKEWIKAKRPKGTGTNASTPASNTKKPSFGKK